MSSTKRADTLEHAEKLTRTAESSEPRLLSTLYLLLTPCAELAVDQFDGALSKATAALKSIGSRSGRAADALTLRALMCVLFFSSGVTVYT